MRHRIGNRRRHERPAIGIFGDHQPVALEQRRHHRFGWNVEWLGDEAVERQHGKQHPQQSLDLAPDAPSRATRPGVLFDGRPGVLLNSQVLAVVVQSSLHLVGREDDEGLRPGMVVGHRQMDMDGVARRRKGVKPRLAPPVRRKRRRARRRVDHANVLHEHAALEAGADRFREGLLGGEALGQRPGAGERARIRPWPARCR